MKKLSKNLLLLIGLTSLVFLGCQGEKKKGKSKDEYFTVKRGEILQKVTVGGNVHPEKRTMITAPFNGYIKKLYVKVGDRVKKNGPVITVVQTLLSNDPVFPIRSPFAGTVVDVNKDEGEYVKKGDTNQYLLRIDKLDQLMIISKVPEIDVSKLKKGQIANIKVSSFPNTKFSGIVHEVSLAPLVSNNWRDDAKILYKTKIKIKDAKGLLRPGMSVIMDIVTDKKENVLRVPYEYIIKNKEGYFVFNDEGKKKVEVGLSNDSFFEVKKGLSENERLKKIDLMSFFNKSSK